MNKYKKFREECIIEIKEMSINHTLSNITIDWISAANKLKYSYHFDVAW